ncbi:MAG: serine dehydratase subunit alpha family protein [Candidatus Muiribacteriota bacterium]
MNFKDFYKKNVKLAYGCTEPVAVGFAAAHATKLLGDKPIRKLVIITDRNIFKNGFGAGIPGSGGKTGNLYAGALGAFIKKPELGFEIFSDVSDDIYNKASEFVEQNRVNLLVDKEKQGIFILVKAYTYGDEYAVSEVKYDHLNLVKLIKNAEIVYEKTDSQTNKSESKISMFDSFSFQHIIDIINNIPEDDLKLTENVINTNIKAAEYGLKHPCGLELGITLKKLWDENKLCRSAQNYIKYMVAGACDARMGGEKVGVMSLCGSGNQGIAASVPVYCYFDFLEMTDKTKLYKALALSFLITGYIKEKLGKLSPVCGCVSASASGAAAGISYLMGNNKENIINSISNLLADITGVICDGAKGSCSLKLSSACANSVNYALLSLNSCVVDEHNGIIENEIENTIENLKIVSHAGMASLDDEIVKIFENKIKKGINL